MVGERGYGKDDATATESHALPQLPFGSRLCGRSPPGPARDHLDPLRRHSQIEAELFYPALRASSVLDVDLVDAARIEHRTLDELVLELSHTDPRSREYAGKIDALAMYAAHHFREEEAKLFPRARASGLDLAELARRMAHRKAELEG